MSPKVIATVRVRHTESGKLATLTLREDATITHKWDERNRSTVVVRNLDRWSRNRDKLIRWAVLNGYHRVAELPEADNRPSWEVEAHERIVRFLLKEGRPVDDQDTRYGWQAMDYAQLQEHVDRCGIIVRECAWDDADWSEWGGTLGDDTYHKGIELLVYCKCGQIAGRTWRYTGTHGELLRTITSPER